MRCITEHKKWGVLQPRDTCTNTGEPVLDLLWSKHPEASAPLDISLEAYPRQTPELLPENLTEDTEIEVAWRLSGGAGQGGTNSVSLQHWLLQFDKTSGELRQIITSSPSIWQMSDLHWPPIARSCQTILLALKSIPVFCQWGWGKPRND